jgi:hypothetical protein
MDLVRLASLTRVGGQPLAESTASPATLDLEDPAELQQQPVIRHTCIEDLDPESNVITNLEFNRVNRLGSRNSCSLGSEDSLPRLFNLEERCVELTPDHSPRRSPEVLGQSAPSPVRISRPSFQLHYLDTSSQQQCHDGGSSVSIAAPNPPLSKVGNLEQGSLSIPKRELARPSSEDISVVMRGQAPQDCSSDASHLSHDNMLSSQQHPKECGLLGDDLPMYLHSDSLPKLFNILGDKSESYDLVPMPLHSEQTSPAEEMSPGTTTMLTTSSNSVVTHIESAASVNASITAHLTSKSIACEGGGSKGGSQAYGRGQTMKGVMVSRRNGGSRTSHVVSGSYMMLHTGSLSSTAHHLSASVRRGATSWQLPKSSVSEDGATVDVTAMRLGSFK